MSLMSYKISDSAHEDIEQIWFYTFHEIEYLAENPNSGKDFSHARKNYRYAKVKSHIIFYRNIEKQKRIEIIRVLHQRMNIENR